MLDEVALGRDRGEQSACEVYKAYRSSGGVHIRTSCVVLWPRACNAIGLAVSVVKPSLQTCRSITRIYGTVRGTERITIVRNIGGLLCLESAKKTTSSNPEPKIES